MLLKIRKECFILRTKIRDIRTKKKLTQSQLAEKIGISRAYLAEIELGTKTPSLDVAKRICQVLKVKIGDL